MTISLGIDTGGTYTDAVLLKNHSEVIATAKSLTTRHNLVDGITAAILQLPAELFSQITLVSLSTTLATNAVVEDQGTSVLGLFVGYNDKQIERVKIPDIIGKQHCHLIEGGHSAYGKEIAPLDIQKATEVILKYKDSVSAIAVSSMFSVRNASHEKELVELVKSLSDKPVTCGHELAVALDAPRRALTAVLNARLVSFIRELVVSVHKTLDELKIDAPVMIVKGDGSLVNTKVALTKPVETVLSGPAASVMGAKLLSGEKNIIVADMGGTTTDIAIVKEGEPKINSHGAKVGNWSPMVNAIEVHAIGLGGDSEVRFGGGGGELVIGPRRVVPMSLLCSLYPECITALEAQLGLPPSSRLNRFAMAQYSNAQLLKSLDDDEKRVWERLQQSPIEVEKAVFEDRKLARAIPRLHRRGMVIYSGFTPSDAAHVLGRSNHWSVEGAKIAAKLWIRQMRRVYGLGLWGENDIEAASQQVADKVVSEIANILLEVGLSVGDYGIDEKTVARTAQDIGKLLWGENRGDDLFHIDFAKNFSLVAVGAPAASYYPAVSERINCRLILPPHGDVSNAIGTVASVVSQTVSLTITELGQGAYRVHAVDIIEDFEDYDEALNFTKKAAADLAIAKAKEAGAVDVKVDYQVLENKVSNNIDGDVFFEATVTAKASGRPQESG